MREPAALYAILDLPHAGQVAPRLAAAALARSGAAWLQLRIKDAGLRAELDPAFIDDIWRALGDSPTQLVINDDPDLLERVAASRAREGRTLSLHLGQEDLATQPKGWREALRERGIGLGVSTHDAAQVDAAQAFAPDYIGYGPVYSTRSKVGADPVVGLAGLAEAARRSRVPVVAIGGIDRDRAVACAATGVAGVACISALLAEDPAGIEARARNIVSALARR